MPDKTGISWTDATWTIVTGCSKVSSGCKNCFAERLAPRLVAMGKAGYTDKPWTVKNAEENVTLRPERLEEPLRWRKPRRVFVTSMGDLFHELVPSEFIADVFRVMAGSQRHTFQVLTKRPERMAGFVGGAAESDHPVLRKLVRVGAWPLRNVWLGTSVENQKAADERIPHLLKTPAAVRFLSCEPLLGSVLLDNGTHSYLTCNGQGRDVNDNYCCDSYATSGECFHGIDWVIAGGESGPGFRPMLPDWPRSLQRQCAAAGVAFFYKQDSGLRPESNALLDGEEWHQFPETTEATHA